MGEGIQLLTVGTCGQGSSCVQWTHRVGVPVAYSGYMTAGGPAAYMYMGQGYSYLQWAHGRRLGGPAAYSGYMGEGIQLLIEGTRGQGIQLLTVGT